MEKQTTTVVIIGSGAAGISAAMSLLETKTAFILLEKGDKLGGAGKFGAEGIFAVESAAQKQQGINYSCSQALREITDFNHYFVNGPLLSRVLRLSADTIDWIAKLGLPTTLEPNNQLPHLDMPPVYHKYTNQNDKFTAWDNMASKITASGNTILTETQAVDLDYSNNQLNGVWVQDSNTKYKINCKAVIIADGGFPGNQEMMKEHFSDSEFILNLGERKSTGAGIKMAAKIGADTNHTPVLFAHGCAPSYRINPVKRDNSVEVLTNLPLFWVDRTGVRFTDEYSVYDHAYWANAAHNAGGYYYVLLDQETIDYLAQNTLDWEDSFARQFTPAGTKPNLTCGPLPKIQMEIDDAIEHGEIFKADSLSELEQKLNFPTNNLKTAVATYNQSIDNGIDTEFFKENKYLKFKVSNGPFYAIKEFVASLGTQSGVNVNSNLEAVRKDGSAIEGVYVVGNNANGMYTDSYPIFEGLANAFAWNSGRIAGQEIGKKF